MPPHAHRDVELGEAAGDECLQARGPCGPRLCAPRPALPVYVRRVWDRRVLGPGLCLAQSVLPQGGGMSGPTANLGRLLSNGLHALPTSSFPPPRWLGPFRGGKRPWLGRPQSPRPAERAVGDRQGAQPRLIFFRRTNGGFSCSKHSY